MVDRKTRWKMFWAAGAAMALVAGMVSTVPSAYAGGTIKVDDDKFISIGMGLRMSFNGVENGAANGSAWSNEVAIDNARIYINGGIHKYVKFAFNTECFSCNNAAVSGSGADAGTVGLLDAIGQFEQALRDLGARPRRHLAPRGADHRGAHRARRARSSRHRTHAGDRGQRAR